MKSHPKVSSVSWVCDILFRAGGIQPLEIRWWDGEGKPVCVCVRTCRGKQGVAAHPMATAV